MTWSKRTYGDGEERNSAATEGAGVRGTLTRDMLAGSDLTDVLHLGAHMRAGLEIGGALHTHAHGLGVAGRVLTLALAPLRHVEFVQLEGGKSGSLIFHIPL